MSGAATAADGSDDSLIVADAIRTELSLGEGVSRFSTGSLPVFAVGDRYVVKLFPRDQHRHFETEVTALNCAHGSLSIPTPRVVAVGNRNGWHYVAMTRLAGQSLDRAWQEISASARLELMRQVGLALGELHAIPAGRCATLDNNWPAFLERQQASCVTRHRAQGLSASWANAIGAFLARSTIHDAGRRVFLHTEVMREHLLVEKHGGDWHLTGLIDFEPAMLGAPEYEFAAVGVYLTCAEPGLMAQVMSGYGVTPDKSLPGRILAYTLLHRYSNLGRYLELLPVRSDAGDLDSLALEWFAR